VKPLEDVRPVTYNTKDIAVAFPADEATDILQDVSAQFNQIEEDMMTRVEDVIAKAEEIPGVSGLGINTNGELCIEYSNGDSSPCISIHKIMESAQPPLSAASAPLTLAGVDIERLRFYYDLGYSDRKIASKGTHEDWDRIAKDMGHRFDGSRETHKIKELRILLTR